jgi:tRNA/tmRNA/rRNA uracil-C5-methylase (TrmA/RlmC/RlmD family)
VVVDPPRAGLAASVTAALNARSPRRLTYVSCHPAALARDLALLASRYAVSQLVLMDLFPQTGHLETIAQLVRR